MTNPMERRAKRERFRDNWADRIDRDRERAMSLLNAWCTSVGIDGFPEPTHRATVQQLDENGKVWRTFTRSVTLTEADRLTVVYKNARITTEEI